MDYKPKGPSLTDRLLGGYKQKKADEEREALERIFDGSFQATLGKMETLKSQVAEKNSMINEYTPLAEKLLSDGKETEAAPYCNDIGAAQEEIKVLQSELREYQAMSDSFRQARDTVVYSGSDYDEVILEGFRALDKYAPKLGIEVNSKVRSAFARFRRKKSIGSTVKVKGAYQPAGTYTDYGNIVKAELLAKANAQAKATSKRREEIDSELDKFEKGFSNDK